MKRSHIIIMIVSFISAVAILAGSIFFLSFYSTAPEYSEIEKDFRKLMESSQELDEILFGKGLPTYERIYSQAARGSENRFETGEKYTTQSGKEFDLIYFYYKVDEASSVYAFKKSVDISFSYAFVSDKALDGEGIAKLKQDFPLPDTPAEQAEDGEAESTEDTAEADKAEGETDAKEETAPAFYERLPSYEYDGGKFSYLIPYTEEIYSDPELFLYEVTDEKEYDYVRKGEEYPIKTVDDIRKKASEVYSSKYMASMETTFFGEYVELGDGERELVTKGRFYEDTRLGEEFLLQTNKEEDIFFTEKCVYDFSTAKVIKRTSNASRVNISISYSFPSEPEKKYEAKISLSLENEKWYLSSSTFAVKPEQEK